MRFGDSLLTVLVMDQFASTHSTYECQITSASFTITYDPELIKLVEAKVSGCFDEMVAIVSVAVDLYDSTTDVRDIAP